MDNTEKLWQRMADLTLPECRNSCRLPLSCCLSEYCELARSWAEERYGIVLQETGHPTLPFMGKTGCTVAPYLRPLCTLHVCSVNALGYKPGDEDFTSQYFALRNEIDEAEGLIDE